MATPLTPDYIKAVWAGMIENYDSVLASPDYNTFLVADNQNAAQYSAIFTALAARRRDEPLFFTQYNYEWAFEPSAYDFPIDAAYQVRVLDLAIALWKMGYGWDKPKRRITLVRHQSELSRGEVTQRLDNIVARSTFLSRFVEATPFAPPLSASVNFIVCPLAWTECLRWFFAGFTADLSITNETLKDNQNAWAQIPHTSVGLDHTFAKRHWITIIAKMIASQPYDTTDLVMPEVTSTICTKVVEFRAGIIDIAQSADSSISNDLQYLALEMSFAHEVGHVFQDHYHSDHAEDSENFADTLGLVAFATSWGWRSWCLKGAGLSNLGGVALGAMVFSRALLAFAASRLQIVQALGAQSQESYKRRKTNLESVIRRGQRTGQHVEDFLRNASKENYWPEREGDEPIIKMVLNRLDVYLQEFVTFTATFTKESQHAVSEALKIASG